MPQRVVILGSTGSIGRSTLDVIAALPERFQVVGLAAGRNRELLIEQARRFSCSAVSILDSQSADAVREALPGCRVMTGDNGATELVQTTEAEIVVNAIVGVAGLSATVEAVRRVKRVAIANKEPLVVAGPLILAEAKRHGTELTPIDSEHSALWQAMLGGRSAEIVHTYLTASGGPFRQWTRRQMDFATVEQALAHPTWRMGRKITVDSATMVNKALEIVEACRLFDLTPDTVRVLVHPESVVHSIVQFCDGSFLAQLSSPDMRVPISYALTYPERLAGPAAILDVYSLKQLTFEPPDVNRFPAIGLGYEVVRSGGTSGAVLNGANEVAVEAFLDGKITFGKIVPTLREVMSRHKICAADDLEVIYEADRWARAEAAAVLGLGKSGAELGGMVLP